MTDYYFDGRIDPDGRTWSRGVIEITQDDYIDIRHYNVYHNLPIDVRVKGRQVGIGWSNLFVTQCKLINGGRIKTSDVHLADFSYIEALDTRPLDQRTTTAFTIKSKNKANGAHFHRIKVNGNYRAVRLKGDMEGGTFRDVNIVGCYDGIHREYIDYHFGMESYPGINVCGGHINVANCAISALKQSQGTIVDTLIHINSEQYLLGPWHVYNPIKSPGKPFDGNWVRDWKNEMEQR